jgi:hypothetical protein
MTAESPAHEYLEILYDVADRVATITLNVPDKRNRLSYRIRRETLHALHRAEDADDCRRRRPTRRSVKATTTTGTTASGPMAGYLQPSSPVGPTSGHGAACGTGCRSGGC